MSKPHTPEAIIFDWDNTLTNTWPTIHACLNKAFTEMGHEEWTLEEVMSGKRGIHRSLRDSFPEIFEDRWEEAREIYYNAFKEIHIEHLSPLPDAEAMLEQLKQQDYIVCVVSNKTGTYLREEVNHLGWNKYFYSVVGANDAKKDKPNPEPVKMALDGSGILPSQHVWFVGDSATDLECAFNSGCQPVFFGDTDIPYDMLADDARAYVEQRVGQTFHFRDHPTLIEYFKG